MLWANLKAKFKGATNLLGGKKDLLEACCAAAAYIAAADGDIDPDEVKTLNKCIVNHEGLSGYSQGDITACIDKMLARAQGGTSGKMGLMKEIEDVREAAPEVKNMIVAIALDVANADGNVGEKEQKSLQHVARALSVNLNAIQNL